MNQEPNQEPLSFARRRQVKDCTLARLGLQVGKQARQMLIRRVRNGNVKYARKLTNSRTVIVLDHEGEEMAFLYSSASKEILGFLLPDAPETADWRRSQSTPPRSTPLPGQLRLDGARR
jgi:hypothetical protein